MRFIVATFLAFSVACLPQTMALAGPPEIILWTDGVPDPVVPSEPSEKTETAADGLTRRFNVSNPRLFVHAPEKLDDKPRAAVIVVPGGGFGRLADEHEGSDVCTWLNAQGIVAFQLAYRTPTNKQTRPESGPVQDLRRAISLVRSRSSEFQVDPDRIGAMGFSAGGLTTFIAAGQPGNVNSAVDNSTKPNAVLLIYPWRIWDEKLNSVHAAVKLDAAFPPTFIAQAADDTASSTVGSTRVFLELTVLKVPVEFHIYEKGGHGFGMRPRAGAPGTRDWQDRARDWLQLRGFTSTKL